MWSRLAAVAGVLLALAALAIAFRPFDHRIDLRDQQLDVPVSLQCRAPLVGAWNTDDKGPIALWAVTVDTNMAGYTGSNDYEVRGDVKPYCASPARHRLALSVAVLIGGAALTAFGRRTMRTVDSLEGDRAPVAGNS
jgi:hypothetical protein